MRKTSPKGTISLKLSLGTIDVYQTVLTTLTRFEITFLMLGWPKVKTIKILVGSRSYRSKVSNNKDNVVSILFGNKDSYKATLERHGLVFESSRVRIQVGAPYFQNTFPLITRLNSQLRSKDLWKIRLENATCVKHTKNC